MIELTSWFLVFIGIGFFTAGSIGLLRLPDLTSRLHALTKADNLGLGLIVIGLVLQQDSILFAIKLVLIWLLVMAGSAVSAHLMAQCALRRNAR